MIGFEEKPIYDKGDRHNDKRCHRRFRKIDLGYELHRLFLVAI